MNRQVLTLYVIEHIIKGLLLRPDDMLLATLTPLYHKTLRVHCLNPDIYADIYLAKDCPKLLPIKQATFEPRFDDMHYAPPSVLLSFANPYDYLAGIYELTLLDCNDEVAPWQILQTHLINQLKQSTILTDLAWQGKNTYSTFDALSTLSSQNIAQTLTYFSTALSSWVKLDNNPPTTKVH